MLPSLFPEIWDVEIDGDKFIFDTLDDIKTARTRQHLAGYNLSPTCNLDKKEKAIKLRLSAERKEARAALQGSRQDKKGRVYTESAYSA